MPAIHLKPGRERSLLRRHPWIFSGAVARLDGSPEIGETVELYSSAGECLGRAAYSPHSQIRARVWTFDPSEPVDADFFRRRICASIRSRGMGLDELNVPKDSEACRLVYAESDGLPGLVVDRYADVLVAQFLSAGVERWKGTLADILTEVTGFSDLYERSDADVRLLEGLPSCTGSLRGSPPPGLVTITEADLKFQVDIEAGHKTGFYLDQAQNRLHVQRLASGRDVLDCFCYTGGFTVHALAGGARSVLSLDSSMEALTLCRENVALNRLPISSHQLEQGDVFQLLRRFRDEGRTFDMVILDPPKFAPTSSQVEKAARGYKDINLLGFKLLRPAGLLVTFSCSGGVDALLFQKIVAGAALDAGVDAQVIAWLSQSPDHPVALSFPESAYLRGLVCRR